MKVIVCRVGINALLLLAVLQCWVPATTARAQDTISFVCTKLSFADCIKVFEKASGLVVKASPSLLGKPVSVTVENQAPLVGIQNIVASLDLVNHTIEFDKASKTILVSVLGEAQPASSSTSAQAPTGDVDRPSGPVIPSIEEFRKHASKPATMTGDIELPGGQKVSARQMEAAMARAEVVLPPPDAVAVPSLNGSKPVTFGEVKAAVERATKSAGQEPDLPMPDGSTVKASAFKATPPLDGAQAKELPGAGGVQHPQAVSSGQGKAGNP